VPHSPCWGRVNGPLMPGCLGGSASKPHLAKISSDCPLKHPEESLNFLARKRLLLASQESAICLHVGLCTGVTPSHNATHQQNPRLYSKFETKWIEHERGFRDRRQHA